MSPRGWMNQGTTLFLDNLATIGDHLLEEPTALPGWTGRHLVAHVHYNALALCRLASWAATGAENPMYASPEQRNDEIEQGGRLPAAQLREFVRGSAAQLADTLDALPPEAWRAQVVTAQGRTVPATEITWMRTREVFVHAVDLGAGATFSDMPDDVLAALLVDVVRKRAGAGECAPLVAWLTGRATSAPPLGRWL